ncbi:MAG: hypothetical protein RL150_539 [Candidatus Parcubacteria bacterium]|jgi:hypothetical protein
MYAVCMQQKDYAAILGLTAEQARVLNTLHKTPLSIPDLAKAARVPRTSLYYMLTTLQARSLVKKRKLHKTWLWEAVPIADTIDAVINALGHVSGTPRAPYHLNLSKTTHVHVASSNEETLREIETLANLPAGSRWYGIQPRMSLIAAITRNSLETLVRINTQIKTRKHIVEAAIHESGTEAMWQQLPGSSSKKLLQALGGRSADTAKLPEHFLANTKAELYLYGETVTFINWEKGFSVAITNPDVFELVKGMFDSTKYLLERYDQNEKIARKLIDMQ